MDLAHLSLPGWFVWLAAILGLITGIIAIIQSVRVSNESETFDNIFTWIGTVIRRTLSIALPLMGILVVVSICALCGNVVYSSVRDYYFTPQVKFDSETITCNQSTYITIENPTFTA